MNLRTLQAFAIMKQEIQSRLWETKRSFDINTKGMKKDHFAPSEISKVYNTIGKELKLAGFVQRIQQSAYRTVNDDGVNAILELLRNKNRFPLFCKYKTRVHLMGCDEYSDVTGHFDV